MSDRQCFPCTACCQGWLPAKVNGVSMKPGKPCNHAGKQGCEIYDRRPQSPCRNFLCAWLREPDQFPEHMKPFECGAIVLLDRRWHNRPIIRAIPTSKKIPKNTLDWLMAYSRERSLPLVFSEHIFNEGTFVARKSIGYGPPSFIHAVETEVGPEDVMR